MLKLTETFIIKYCASVPDAFPEILNNLEAAEYIKAVALTELNRQLQFNKDEMIKEYGTHLIKCIKQINET